MILQANQLFDDTGAISSSCARWLTGFQRVRSPIVGLTLTEQSINVLEPVTLQETVSAGVYFTFNTVQPTQSLEEAHTLQIQPIFEKTNVNWQVEQPKQFAWMQLYISWDQLAAITSESVAQTQRFFARQTQHTKGAPIQLPHTQALLSDVRHLRQQAGKHLALTGKLYNLIFQAIEHLQIHHHITQCEGCQKKLFQAQNRLESHTANTIKQLAQDVELTPTALELGFSVITQMTLYEYQIDVAIRHALRHPNNQRSLAHRLTEDTGLTTQDIEKACLKRFGVLSHQLGSMQ